MQEAGEALFDLLGFGLRAGEPGQVIVGVAEVPEPAVAGITGIPGGQAPPLLAQCPPGPGLLATRTGHGWRLDGTKQYCSGARSCTDALVTAAAPDGNRLFAVSTRDLSPVPGSWPATGMAASGTLDVEFTNISAQPASEPGRYTSRPGFAHGGAGMAACWYGGARGVGRTLLAAAAGHLRTILAQYEAHYNGRRPHRSRELQPPRR